MNTDALLLSYRSLFEIAFYADSKDGSPELDAVADEIHTRMPLIQDEVINAYQQIHEKRQLRRGSEEASVLSAMEMCMYIDFIAPHLS